MKSLNKLKVESPRSVQIKERLSQRELTVNHEPTVWLKLRIDSNSKSVANSTELDILWSDL